MRTALATCLLMLAAPATADPLLDSYARTVIGTVSTRNQHESDPRYEIAEASVARIWPTAGDGLWLYQEQAIVNRPGQTEAHARSAPYFQRIGHVTPTATGLRRDNHSLRDPARFIGLGHPGYSGPQPTRADFGPAGCLNIITPIAPGHFTATTENCANSYRGATTMLSLAISTPDTYANWDRGFDAAGVRVWGPATGGYIFRRQIVGDRP